MASTKRFHRKGIINYSKVHDIESQDADAFYTAIAGMCKIPIKTVKHLSRVYLNKIWHHLDTNQRQHLLNILPKGMDNDFVDIKDSVLANSTPNKFNFEYFCIFLAQWTGAIEHHEYQPNLSNEATQK